MELAEQIPWQYRVSTENTKLAMRKAALKAAPPKTANKKKLGFPVPIRVWLREDKYYNIVKDAFTSANAEKFFNTPMLVKLLDDHRAENTTTAARYGLFSSSYSGTRFTSAKTHKNKADTEKFSRYQLFPFMTEITSL